jgi:hypothetical protein
MRARKVRPKHEKTLEFFSNFEPFEATRWINYSHATIVRANAQLMYDFFYDENVQLFVLENEYHPLLVNIKYNIDHVFDFIATPVVESTKEQMLHSYISTMTTSENAVLYPLPEDNEKRIWFSDIAGNKFIQRKWRHVNLHFIILTHRSI